MSTRWGEAIQRLLLERGWTKKRLAEAAALRPNTLTNIITHGRDTDTATLSRVAAAFEVDVAELFLTGDQSDMLRVYSENRISRIKESVMAELSATVSRLVREDYERFFQEQNPAHPGGKRTAARTRRRR